MLRKAKPSITDWGHAQQPDFSIPVPGAKHHHAAAQHYEDVARYHRQAAKLPQTVHPEKASQQAQMADAHHLPAEQRAEEAANAHAENHRNDSHSETNKIVGQIEKVFEN